MAENTPSLTVPKERVEALIERKTEGEPAKRAELLTRAQILRPLLESPDNLGLNEQEKESIRKYAKRAGEKAAKEASLLLGQSPVERLDEIVYEVGSQIPPDDFERTSFLFMSRGLRDMARKNQDVVVLEQQRRELNGEPSSFDIIADELIAKTHHTGPTILKTYSLNMRPDRAEQVLKRLGIIKADMTLALLRTSNKWMKFDKPNANGELGYSRSDSSQMWGGHLDTGIDGVLAFLTEIENKPYRPNEPKTRFKIDLSFNKDAMKAILKAPVGESIFDQQKSPEPSPTSVHPPNAA